MATLTNFSLPKYFPNSTFHNSTPAYNDTGLGPYNISIFPTIPPPIYIPAVVVSNDDSSFYDYGYYYFALLGLLVLAGTWAKVAAQRRQQATRAALNQRLRARQANTTVTTISNCQMGTNEVSNNDGNTQPKDDMPPAYDEVMQTYINAKLELQAQEESGAVGGGGMSAAVSSITIETEVDTTASTNDLTVTSSTTTATTTTTTTVPPDAQTQPPPYESPNGLRSKNDNVV